MSDERGPRRARGRAWVVVALVLVAALLVPAALAASWVRSTVTDADGYVQAMAGLAEDEEVRDALVDQVTTVALREIDVDGLVEATLDALARGERDSRLELLGPPLRFSLESLVRTTVDRLVRSDRFLSVWVQANRGAHSALLAVLTGSRTGLVSLADDGAVSANLAPVLDAVVAELAARDVTVPESVASLDVSVPLFSSPELARARGAYRALDTLAPWLGLAAAATVVAAVAVGRSRATVAWTGAGIAAATGAVALAATLGRSSYLASLDAERLRTVVTERVAETVVDSFRDALVPGVVVGAVLLLGALAVPLVRAAVRRVGGPGTDGPGSAADDVG